MSAPAPERLALTTADGLELEAELHPPADPEPRAGAVICHPHPLYGGSMHNNVVHRLITDLPPRGVAALRFNFRGTGRSEGRHGGGTDERHDVVAAVDALAARYPAAPIIVAGYSFGADVSLAVDDDRVAGWLAVSPPLRVVDPQRVGGDVRPVVEIEEHRGVTCGGHEHVLERPEDVRTYGLTLVFPDQPSVRGLPEEHVEVIEPEIRHHFLELTLRVHRAL